MAYLSLMAREVFYLRHKSARESHYAKECGWQTRKQLREQDQNFTIEAKEIHAWGEHVRPLLVRIATDYLVLVHLWEDQHSSIHPSSFSYNSKTNQHLRESCELMR